MKTVGRVGVVVAGCLLASLLSGAACSDEDDRRGKPASAGKQGDRTPGIDTGRKDAAPPAKGKGAAGKDLRKIPLLIVRVFIPADTDDAKKRLDDPAEYAPGDAVAAALVGAKVSGWTAGYEFTPVEVVDKAQKPRDFIGKLPKDADVFLLLRVSSRTPSVGKTSMVWMLADAALYRRKDLSMLAHGQFMAMGVLDSKQVTDGKVKHSYWMRRAAEEFADKFDPEVLAKLQGALDKDRIAKAIADLSKRPGARGLEPTVTPLGGEGDQPPQLEIKTKGAGKSSAIYLLATEQQFQRKWVLDVAKEVKTPLKGDTYTLYIEVKDDKTGATRSLYRSKVKMENKKKYSYEVP